MSAKASTGARGAPASPSRSFVPAFLFGLLTLSAVALPMTPGTARAHGFQAGDIEVVHPWSRAVPAGARVAAGYVVLKNEGSEADRLISATAEIAGRTEIHEMTVDAEGIMRMRPLADGVKIPPGEQVELKPGSIHLMFLDLEGAPPAGESFSGTLTFEKAGTVDVEFDVQVMGAQEPEHGAHDH